MSSEDWRAMMDKTFIGSWDLGDKDFTLTIKEVKPMKMRSAKGDGDKNKPVIWFEEAQKPLVANATNCKIIAALYTNDTRKWVGKKITLYKTTTQLGRDTVDCVRVRPTTPGAK